MEPLNPVQIEQNIRELVNRIANGIQIYTERYRQQLEAGREFDRAFAHAYLKAEGSVKDRERVADLETIDLRADKEEAEVLYRQADKLLKALDSELRGYQTISASVRQMYAVAGRGEGA